MFILQQLAQQIMSNWIKEK